jgi:hypothetical protein
LPLSITSFNFTTVGPGRGRGWLPPPADWQEFPACRRKYYKPAAAARRQAGIPCLSAEILQTVRSFVLIKILTRNKSIGAKDFFAVQMTFELRLNWNPEYGDDRNIPCGRQIPDWYQSAESRNSGGLVLFPRGPNL